MAKRKGLMDVLSDYRREEAQKREYKAKKTPDYSKKAAGTKSSTKKAFSGKAMGGSGKKKSTTAVAFSSGSFMKTKPANSKPKTATKATSSQPKPKPSAQSNNDGTYGKSMPSNPKVGVTMKPRQRRPGTGRTGQAAALAARRDQNKPKNVHKETMTAAERRAMRLKSRRGR